MDFPNNNFDELLSGMLDGMLSDQELRVLEQAMADDPSLEVKLEELAASRSALLRGRSRGRLGPEFAQTVTSKARERAVAMGSDAPDWLVPSDFKRPNTDIKPVVVETVSPLESIPVFKRAWVYSCVGIAAVFALVFVFVREPQKQGLVQLDPKPYVMSEESELKVIEKAEELLAAGPIVNESVGNESADDAVSLGTNPNNDLKFSIANSETQIDSMANSEAVVSDETESNSSSVHDKANQVAAVPKLSIVEGNAGSIVATAQPKQSQKSSSKKFRTLVMYVTIDPVALENRALEAILEDRKIVYTDDLIITEKQMESLVDSRLIGAETGTDGGSMQVLFLRSTAQNLGSALDDILNQYKDFPECSMDMTEDVAAKQLVKQLSKIEVAEGKSGIAKRFAPPNGTISSLPFAASARSQGRFTRPELVKRPMSALMSGELNEMSNVLLFIRPAE